MPPHVAVVTGKYGGWRAMLPMIRQMHGKGWKVDTYACDQHLSSDHGYTIDLLRKQSPSAVVGLVPRALSISRLPTLLGSMAELATYLVLERPDALIVYGDRADALLGALVGQELRIPVAHLQAGDISGGIDNVIRFAASELANWCFAPTELAFNTLRHLRHGRGKMSGIYNVGDHHLDAVAECMIDKPVRGKYAVVHLHSDTLASEKVNVQIADHTISAVIDSGLQPIVFAPCTDSMGESITRVLASRLADVGEVVRPMIPMEEYIPLLQGAQVFVGNSSTAVIECPFLGVPAVLVGDRQRGRDENNWCYKVSGRRPFQIFDYSAWNRRRVSIRGQGDAGTKTINILEQVLA